MEKKELIHKIEGMKVVHGNYHCGVEECCGKNTKARQKSTALSDAECRGYNRALSDVISMINNPTSH